MKNGNNIFEKEVKSFIALKKLSELTQQYSETIGEISELKNKIERAKNNHFELVPLTRRLVALEGQRDRLKDQIQNLK